MSPDEQHQNAAHRPEDGAAPGASDEVAEALKKGPIGALLIASIAVGLLFLAWLAFYFFLFLPRGSIG